MATFNDYWARLVLKKPELVNDSSTVTMSAKNFRQVLKKVHEAGERHGIATMETLREKSGIVPNIFDKIFGSR